MDEKDLFLKKFEEKLKARLDSKTLSKLSGSFDDDFTSSDYENFRLESLPSSFGTYEKVCNFLEKVLPLSPDKKSEEKIKAQLYKGHLNCTPTGVMSTSVSIAMTLVIFGVSLFLLGKSSIGLGIVLIGLVSYFLLQNVPSLIAKRVKAKANDQVIIAVFYIVAFMRFNSNLELATQFAANYLNPPLALDFKRLLWQLENAEFPNIKVAYDKYLEEWRETNLEFLEAIYLIESSLFESEDFRRISLLDKSLETILQGSYERMLHFAQELRTKVSTFNMVGIVLPILGLIILPLAASFGDPKSTWEFVFLLYNIIFPLGVGYFGFLIIYDRPSGVNSVKSPDIKELNKIQKIPIKLGKEKTIYLSPKVPSFFILGIFLLIGLLPIIVHTTGFDTNLNLIFENLIGDGPFGTFQEYKEIDPDEGMSYSYGPYGTYPGILSLFIPLAFAFAIGYYFRFKYKNLIHIRDKTKKLELEFSSATFQLGNRINEGIAAELAFGTVAETMKGTQTGDFFSNIDTNVKFNGLSVEQAIFDKEKGAINMYPSDLITSSMKIFVKANEKGPEIAAKTLIDLSKYLSDIHMSNERIKDLLAESLSSMKGQASFLAPLISGVVISIVSLVTMIMGSLTKATESLAATAEGVGGAANFLGDSIPTYLFQSVVGLYIVMLIALLVYMVTNLENGDDKILTRYEIGEKLIKGLSKYAIIVALGIIGFTFVGWKVLGNII